MLDGWYVILYGAILNLEKLTITFLQPILLYRTANHPLFLCYIARNGATAWRNPPLESQSGLQHNKRLLYPVIFGWKASQESGISSSNLHQEDKVQEHP